MKGQITTWGNSLAIRIPKAIAEEAQLHEGDSVDLSSVAPGKVQIRLLPAIPTLDELVAEITPANRHGEVKTGRSVGREAVEW
jgi:antitoxin MazE